MSPEHDRKVAEDALGKGEVSFRSLLQHVLDVVAILDADGTLRYASPAVEAVLGYAPEEVIGNRVFDYVHPDDLERAVEALAETLVASGALPPLEFRARRADGTWRHVEVVRNNRLDDPGVGGVVINVRDVTERKADEEELNALRREYEELVGSVEAIIWKGEAQTLRFTFVSDQAEAILGYPAQRWTQEPSFWSDHIHPEDREWAISFCRKAVAKKENHDFEYRMISADSGVVWLRAVVRVGVEDGVPTQLFGVMVDITGLKEAEKALKESEERYRAVTAQSVEAIYMFDAETKRILESNVAFRRLMGYAEEELLGMRIYDFIAHDNADIDRNVRRSLEQKQRHIGERRYRRKDGSVILVDTSASVISYGGRTALCAVSRDVTERREAEEVVRKSEARLAETQRLAHLGGWEWDIQTEEVSWSDEVYRIYGFAPQELVPSLERFMEVVHPEDRGLIEGVIDGALNGYEPYDLEHRIVRPDGEVRWVHRRAEVVRGEGGEPLRMVGTVHDITERKEAEERYREAEERYRNVVEQQTELVCRFLPDLTLTFANEAYGRYFGQEPEELIGESFMGHIPEEDHAYYVEDLSELTPDNPTRTIEHRVFDTEGEVRWQQWTDTAIFDREGNPVEYQSVGRDVTDRKALEERLEHHALHDSLTDLPNRRLFEDRLGQALRRIRRRKEIGLAVLFMDLDGFKVVNDSLGHDAGDRLLVEVAKRLGSCLRPEDTLARFGGDEFTVLIEDARVLDAAVRVAERIVENLREPFTLDGRELYLATSIGVGLAGDGTKNAEELLREADTAMYMAKDEGGTIRVFDPAMHGRAVYRLELESDLRRAIEHNEFVVHYQPIVNLQTGELWGVEALVRWEHPEQGLLDPYEFVPVAEESGLVVPMGELVLEEACRRAVEWQRAFLRTPPLAMTVNLSGRQLRRPDLHEVIGRALRESGLSASSLGLDITETVYISALDANTAALDRLQALGIRISLDDFGSGYSSLSYLKRLPADILKIDKSFTKGLGVEVEDTAILQTVVDLAHILGMEVVAEGVEIEEQETLLKEMDCDMAQGNYFSKPLPPEAVSDFLNSTYQRSVHPNDADSLSDS
ncbi:MAG TPA: PAS domain S-box protein [Rubrobacteraceae bacterium]|nr:PAS domain S-box protein [Rubrobacteraceae bacterium]